MPQNSEINLLPAKVAEQIAAGEVVDRPLSAVKELVENSIDAGADSIVLEIKNGGKTYIRVTDNGSGISSGQVKKAFLRHATSKIKNTDDLRSIGTLGFRGEALTSIAAVSKLAIITKTAEENMGTHMIIEGGAILENNPTGCPDGTTLIVTDLFYNTPARLKFMKTDSAEGAMIIDFLSKMALAYPDIRFRMINNGTVLFATRGNGSIYHNILTVYSKQTANSLIEIDERKGEYRLIAYISPSDVNRPNRRGQVYFVNGRSISSKILEAAVSTAYKERMPQGRNPLVYFFLQVPSDKLDVNIHPNKREIRFDDNAEISDFVINALKKGLQSREGLPSLRTKQPFKPVKSVNQGEQVDIKSLLSNKRKETASTEGLNQNNRHFTAFEKEHYYETNTTVNIGTNQKRAFHIDGLKPLGSVFATYILAADDTHMYLLDQHAAHERILYEKILEQFKQEEKDTQILIAPLIIETTSATAGNQELFTEELCRMGFVIEAFGVRSLLIKGIPSFMGLQQARDFLDGFLSEIEDYGPVMDRTKLEKIITKSCKSAVKANDLLNEEEIAHLLRELSETENPFSCPHGRPTIILLSKQDIERLFKRG